MDFIIYFIEKSLSVVNLGLNLISSSAFAFNSKVYEPMVLINFLTNILIFFNNFSIPIGI